MLKKPGHHVSIAQDMSGFREIRSKRSCHDALSDASGYSPTRDAPGCALPREGGPCYRRASPDAIGAFMSVDQATIRRIARLARIAVGDDEVPHLQDKLNAILAFVEELAGVDVEGVEPMTSVIPSKMKWRPDEVTDHAGADIVVANAPERADHFFTVPKVVE
jgi:aspartyl-tRNA(Asn)/glutamyl-tRNA(Gln) amidotransferase subunit C